MTFLIMLLRTFIIFQNIKKYLKIERMNLKKIMEDLNIYFNEFFSYTQFHLSA